MERKGFLTWTNNVSLDIKDVTILILVENYSYKAKKTFLVVRNDEILNSKVLSIIYNLNFLGYKHIPLGGLFASSNSCFASIFITLGLTPAPLYCVIKSN